MKVLVGLSGGVDSSVTALLLKEQGYEVIGATMSTWGKGGIYKTIQEKLENNPKKGTHGACFSPDTEDIESARKVAKQLGIDFAVFDCAKEYEDLVLKNFKTEYLIGRTPNPCILCNSLIKFDIFPNLAKLNGIEYDKFATGHYAKVEYLNGRYILKRGINHKKDQSYFLYRLRQEQLKNIILPLGNYTKEQIREIARKNKLEVAEKPDSQDFYEGDYNELLEIKEKEGNIVNREGEILGKHKGIWNYTIGQRKGIGISAKEPLYVVELRKETNEVVVGYKDKTFKNRLKAININWVSVETIENEINCQAKIRSSSEPENVTVKKSGENSIEVEFENMQRAISPGQSIVLYDNETLLGGGIIDEAE